jgi:hypothetical protein
MPVALDSYHYRASQQLACYLHGLPHFRTAVLWLENSRPCHPPCHRHPLALAIVWGVYTMLPGRHPPTPLVLAIAWGVYHDTRSPPTSDP